VNIVDATLSDRFLAFKKMFFSTKSPERRHEAEVDCRSRSEPLLETRALNTHTTSTSCLPLRNFVEENSFSESLYNFWEPHGFLPTKTERRSPNYHHQ
jgi:hypothetical protein